MRILLLLITVIVRPALHDLHIPQLYSRARRLGVYEGGQSDYGCDGECDRGEESEDILEAHERGVHRECSPVRKGYERRVGVGCGLWSGELRDTVAGLEVGAWTWLVFSPMAGALRVWLGRVELLMANTRWRIATCWREDWIHCL